MVTSGDPGQVIYSGSTQSCDPGPGNWATYDGFAWIASDGTSHAFNIQTQEVTGTLRDCGALSVATGSSSAIDSSGYSMSVTNYTDAVVTAPDGTQVYPNFIDTNGNYFSADGSGNLIDILGRTPITKTTTGNQTTYAILNSQNARSNFVVTTQNISVSTSFSGATEYSGTITVIQSVQLPDGRTYQFSYDSGTTPGHYGLLTGITPPTLGQITYGYTNFTDPNGQINRWVSSYGFGAGTWSFTPQALTPCPSGFTTCRQVTVAKPSSDNVVYAFGLNNGAWMAQAQYYSGSISPSNLIKTINQSWNTSNPCPGCPGSAYIQKVSTTTTLPVPGGTSINSTVQFAYDSIYTDNVKKIQEWKYYTGSLPATPDRETDFTYGIFNHPLTMVVCLPTGTPPSCTGSTNIAAKTVFSYDQGTLTSVTGMTHHDDANFGTGQTARGNLTQIQKLVSGTSNYLSASMTYDTTGQRISSTDWAGNQTTFSYTDNFFKDIGDGPSNPPQAYTPASPTNAYLTRVAPPLVPASTYGYYFGTGQLASSTDANSASTYSHFYDSFSRPTSSVLPNGGWTYSVYASSELQVDRYTGITSTFSSGCTSCRHDQTLFDSLGRTIKQFLVNDPDGQTTVATTYDSNSRVATSSNPYRSTSDPTYGLETPAYNGLDRTTQVTHADSNVARLYYGASVSSGGGATSQSCSSATYGIGYPTLAVDEIGNKRQIWTDGFGRTIEADEPNSSGTLNVATCDAYDLNNNLTSVTNSSQTRTYSYDMLSRITSAATPESGTTSVTYDSDSSCPTPNSFPGNPVKRLDARSVRTCLQYDTLNRLTSTNYSDSTPTVTYFYDQSSYNGITITNGKARRTGMSDASGQTAWSYDSVGNVLTEQRTINGVTKAIYYTYNLDSSLATLKYPGGRTVTFTTGNAQRPTSAKDTTNNINFATSATYAPPGGPASIIHGYVSGGFAGITESYAYNNRLQFSSIQATSSAATALSLVFGYAQPSANNGNITAQTNNVDTGRTQSYSYDDLNRLLTAQSQATSGVDCWGLSFGNGTNAADDPVGNLLNETLTKCSGFPLSVSVNSHNQITNTGFSYDVAGNNTADGSYTYTYDAENRVTSAAGVNYTYDGNGFRVKKSSGTLYWRSISGDTIAESDLTGSTTNSNYHEYIFFAGRRVARSDPSAASVYYYFVDQLGSTRAVTQANGTVCFSADYYPYGQELNYSATCPQNYKFTSYERDPETGLDYAFNRYYNPRLGRFMSADPLSGSVADPQSLNRYAYVENNPSNLIDPLGLHWECVTVTVGGQSSTNCRWVSDDTSNPPDTEQVVHFVGMCSDIYLDGVYFGNACNPIPGDRGGHLGGDRGGNNSGGGSILDDRANDLANALNNTGVQSLGNPCTVAAWYGASAAAAVGFSATSAGATVFPETNNAVKMVAVLYHSANQYIQQLVRGTVLASITAVKLAAQVCNSLQ